MGGIEPPMSVPRDKRGRSGSGRQSLLDGLDTQRLDAIGKRRQPPGFELKQARFLDRRNRLLAFFLFQAFAPLFQPTCILFERQALLFQCLCHKGLLFNANRALNEGDYNDVCGSPEEDDERVGGASGLSPDDGSIR